MCQDILGLASAPNARSDRLSIGGAQRKRKCGIGSEAMAQALLVGTARYNARHCRQANIVAKDGL